MARIRRERLTADVEGGFCVFLIGMRVNRWWRVDKWWPVASAMPGMLRELSAHPDLGYLGGHLWFGNPSISLQYWKSFDHLDRYAKSHDHVHLPAWRAFNRAVLKSGEVGVWHESYVIGDGGFECIYSNMPPFGLGAVTRLVPASGQREAAKDRMGGAAGSARESSAPD